MAAATHPNAKVKTFAKTDKNTTPLSLARPFLSGAVTADASPCPVATFDVVTFGFYTSGYDTCLVRPVFSSGTSVIIEPRLLDEEGALWLPMLDSSGNPVKTPALTGSGFFEVTTFGKMVFFRLDTQTGSVHDLEILVAPGRIRLGGFGPGFGGYT